MQPRGHLRMTSSPWGHQLLVTGTLLLLLLLGTHLTSAAPTHTTNSEHSGSSPPEPPTPLTAATTTTHRPTSHPIWHLLLALWRPKDAARGQESPGGVHGALPLPSAARLVQDGGGGGGRDSRSDDAVSATAKDRDLGTPRHPTSGGTNFHIDGSSSTSAASTASEGTDTHPDTSTSAGTHMDADKPQHPISGGAVTHADDSSSSTHIPQHKNLEQQQHPVSSGSDTHTDALTTPQHPGKDTQQQRDLETPQHSVSDAPQHEEHPEQDTQQHTGLGTAQHPDTDTAQHPDEDATQHRDPDTPQHPARNTKPKTDSSVPQHPDVETHQEPDPDTPQHPARNTQPKPSPNTPQHPTSTTPKGGDWNTTQHIDLETHQEPDPDTPQHPARNTQPKPDRQHHHQPLNTTQHPSPSTMQHTEAETQQHPDSDTPRHPTSNTQPKGPRNTTQHPTPAAEETRERDTPQHPARNTKKTEEDSIQPHPSLGIQPHPHPSSQPHPDSSSQSQPHPSSQPHPDPSSQPQPHPSSQPHPDPSSQPHPDPSSQPHPHTSSQPEPPPITHLYTGPSPEPHPFTGPQPHPVPSNQPHSIPTNQPHPDPSSQPHPVFGNQPHPVLNIKSVASPQPHPVPNTQSDPAPTPHPHPAAMPQPHSFPRQSDQPYSSLSHLHPPHAQYHPTPHTQHHPILHIQHHPTSQALHHPTQQPQLHPGTPWRMPHQEEPSSQASMDRRAQPAPPADLPQDGVLQETFGGPEHDEASHPAVMGSHGAYPTSERESSEEDDPPAEPKLDDHFFLHPMPHHRDVMFTSPEEGHPDHHHHHHHDDDDASDQHTSSPASLEAGQHLTTTPRSNFSEAEGEEQIRGVEDHSFRVEEEERTEENASAKESERGTKVLQVQGPVVMESLDDPSLAPLMGQAKEVLTLRDNETTVLALLKVTQTSGGSGDTFQADAMMQAEDAGDPGDDLYSGLSHRDDLRSLEAGAAGTGTAKLVQTESDGHDRLAVLAKKDAKTLDARKTVNALDTAEKSQQDVAAGLASTMKPIYEEISGTLQVDTSIDDVEDFDVKTRHTETTDDFLPPANTSHTNLIDVALHPLRPSDPSDGGDPSLTPTLTSSSSTDPQRPSTHAPLTFTNYLSHYPPKMFSDDDAASTTTAATAGNGTDGWAPYVGNFSELSDASLALNASLIQKSHVLSIEDHYRMVLHERGSLMLQLMDPAADPCEDFYQFACGRWNGKFPIRQDKAVDNTFERLKEDLDDVLRSLLEEEPLPTDNNITATVKTLYGGCMNTEAIEALGAEPLLSLLRELGGWPVLEGEAWNSSGYDWVRQMARLRNYNNDILISEWVAADITNSSNHIIQLDQPELGLPGREYFINPGDYQYREAYLDLMLSVAQLLGASLPTALRDMTEVLHFETHLSRILTPAEERRNLSAVHRRLTVDQLTEDVPQIDWAIYLDTITWNNNHSGEVVVFGLDYFKKLVSLLEFTDDRVVSNYLLWRFVKNRISNLGERYTKVKQDYIKVLFGRQSQPERWRSCVTYVSGNLGYVVGAMFVKRYFPEASKNDTDEMIGLIRESFGTALRGAHWMNEETRQVAQEKVNTIVKNVGYPEYLLNDTYMDQVYAELSFNRETHFDNVLKMLQFHARTNHDLLSVPVNRTAWVTSPAVVNAYYSRSKNMIVFPAGILQPPFYHPAFPRSLNYGGIGVVIGHEITHGFDDRGRQFDKNGNLQQWWTPSDVSQFYQRASCMLDQYGEYQVAEVGLKINPVNTLGENIADNAGIKISYQAYQNWRQNNEETVSLPYVNLTHDQLFFLNFGQIWCEINSPEAMLTKIRSGQHSPNRFRVIGTLSNSEEFSEAFNCPVGSAMNPERKCRVW